MIPDYQTLMLPLLKYISDGNIHNTQNAVSDLAKEFNLSEEELEEWLPSKKQKTFHNRVHWAKAHLKMAGTVENVGRGLFKLTNRGKSILGDQPVVINVKYLTDKFPDYKESIVGFRKKGDYKIEFLNSSESASDYIQTPEEQIEEGYQSIRKTLEQDILIKLKDVHPSYFEKIVVELLVKMGYGGSIAEAGKATKYTNDEGIDGIIKEDKLGLDVIYIQAKRWEGIVPRPEIQKFVGALAGQRAKKGVFITTSGFSKEAVSYASQMDTKIVLIDGEQLAQYMVDYNLGVSVQNTYEIKKLDFDYFEED
ncbi:MAG: putative Mrr restriction system protein [Flaviaesturariibacter sp.]|nr:putative Mrr restriction system protein [Flaviaesturariibacter sp.]